MEATTAEELSLGFKADRAKAEAKFKNRMIPMTGEISSIEVKQDKFGVKTAHVVLKTPPDGMTINCEFWTQTERGTADLKAGDKIDLFADSHL